MALDKQFYFNTGKKSATYTFAHFQSGAGSISRDSCGFRGPPTLPDGVRGRHRLFVGRKAESRAFICYTEKPHG